MDDLDQHLIDKLRVNARAPVAELARALGLSRTTVQSRLAKLERNGVISGYAVKLAHTEAGAVVRAHLMLNIAPRQAVAVTASLRSLPGVLRLQSVSGAYDMIAEVEAIGVGELDLLIQEIGAVRGVERASAAVVLATKFDR